MNRQGTTYTLLLSWRTQLPESHYGNRPEQQTWDRLRSGPGTERPSHHNQLAEMIGSMIRHEEKLT